MMPEAMATHEGKPIRVEIQGQSHAFSQASEMVRLARVLENAATSMRTIQTLTDETAQSVFAMSDLLAQEYPTSSAIDILRRMNGVWDSGRMTEDEPRVYPMTETVVLRYSHDADIATARFDMRERRVAALNFSTDRAYGVKTIMLPPHPTPTSLIRLGEITGGKWSYVSSVHEPNRHIEGRSVTGQISRYADMGQIEVPLLTDLMQPFVREPANLWVSVWGPETSE